MSGPAAMRVDGLEAVRIPGLVSTILPVHNRPALVVEAAQSVLAQTYRPIEVLIVDDGSTDETSGVANELAAGHPTEVRAVRRGQGGPGQARETGRRLAGGEFLQYLDSDDLLMPRKFEVQVAALTANPEAVAAYGPSEEIRADGSKDPAPERPSDFAIPAMFPTFLKARFWRTSVPLYRRQACDAIGAWTDLWLEEDWEYDCRLAALGKPLAFVPEIVSLHRHVAGERLSRGEALDPRRLSFRARAHELIYGHAVRAGIPRESAEMRHFARELFLVSRQCGAAGLAQASRRLFELAREASLPSRAAGMDFRSYRALAGLVGWSKAGAMSILFDRFRPGR